MKHRAEVQAHGNSYEDRVIRERTGISKKEYDNLKENGYTSEYDLVNGLIVDHNGSVKTTSSNTICCSDLLKKMKHTDYRMIVGVYKQVGKTKVFHTEYEFHITPNDYEKLWGDMNYDLVEEYVNKIKSVPKGKEGQEAYQFVAESWKSEVESKTALFKINPKVDSKNQRRVQCSTHIDKLISSGIKYTTKSIDFVVESDRRTFNK